ncbi:MAG: hypothetical protein ABA06_02725 [Parcubacteria bacterium C7867-001]|nr:MAG: hypothetical protein ABA06_02725 [Parcubacteria bacterium C7867-001]
MSAEKRTFTPTEADLTLVRETRKAADPTTISEIGPQELRFAGTSLYRRNIYTDEVGNRWHQMSEHKHPQTQQFLAGLLKGLVNISDVVKAPSGEYVSKELDLEKIKKETLLPEVEAEVALLAVLGDVDHSSTKELYHPDGVLHNIRYEDERVAYFDTEFAFRGLFEKPQDAVVPLAEEEMRKMTQLGFDEFRNKLSLLKERISGPQGKRFLGALVKHTGSPLFDEENKNHALFYKPENYKPHALVRDDLAFLQKRLLQKIESAYAIIDQQKDTVEGSREAA